MTGLIVIFGQIGMTSGVSIIGFLSKKFSIHNAFYITLVPMLILPVLLIFYNKLSYNFNLGES
jgi:MFS-type transporter involved in bile tolerance (Atg22 family)